MFSELDIFKKNDDTNYKNDIFYLEKAKLIFSNGNFILLKGSILEKEFIPFSRANTG